MGFAVGFAALSGGSILLALILLLLGRGFPAGAVVIVNFIAISGVVPVFVRREPWPSGIPGPFELATALVSFLLAIVGGALGSFLLPWIAVILQSVAAFRLVKIPFRMRSAPIWFKGAMGGLILALLGLNGGLMVYHRAWLGSNTRALTVKWFGWPAPIPVAATPTPTPVEGAPPVVSATPTPVYTGPLATVAAKAITKEMVDYQIFVESVTDPGKNGDRIVAIAKLLQAYVSLAILDKKFKGIPWAAYQDEQAWVQSGARDRKQIDRLRRQDEKLFFDVYVGANGLYHRLLRDNFDRLSQQNLRQEAEKVRATIAGKNGVAGTLHDLLGLESNLLYYSTVRHDFVSKIEVDLEEGAPDPKDTMPKELAAVPVRHVLSRALPGDGVCFVVRRVEDDDLKRMRFEVVRVARDRDFEKWFLVEAGEISINIQDPAVREAVAGHAPNLRHLLK